VYNLQDVFFESNWMSVFKRLFCKFGINVILERISIFLKLVCRMSCLIRV